MQSKYCECGHLVLGDICYHCVRHHQLAVVGRRAEAPASTGPNSTLTELRTLKSRLESGLITEAEYDERRNSVLANF